MNTEEELVPIRISRRGQCLHGYRISGSTYVDIEEVPVLAPLDTEEGAVPTTTQRRGQFLY